MARTVSLLGIILILTAACSSSPRAKLPKIRELYSAAAGVEARNPVVVIHGILGARLEERSTRKTVWGAFSGDYADPQTPDGARLVSLPLFAPESALDYDPNQCAVRASGPLGALDIGTVFGVVSVKVYANILGALGIGGFRDKVAIDPNQPEYREDHYTCHTFFYDWRRDNVENAIQFGRFLTDTRKQIDGSARRHITELREAGDADSVREADELSAWLKRGYRFDVVAHSMGGLVARYFLRYGATDLPADGSTPEVTWAGSAEIDRLVLVGTPSLGAADAVQQLCEGFQAAFFLPFFDPAVLGSMPAIYQLMPRNRHGPLRGDDGEALSIDLYDPKFWADNRWGIMRRESDRVLAWLLPQAKTKQARRELALQYLGWCLQRAKQLHTALDTVPAAPCPSRIHLFAADAEDTIARVAVRNVDGRYVPSFDRDDLFLAGDLTVPRYSAIADERTGGRYRPGLVSPIPWSNVTFLSDDHVGITSNPQFVNNMLFLLLEIMPPARH